MSASNARATMREHADPPVSFGGSGGIVWPLGPNAHSQIPATRRPRTDPSGPSALRLRASGPAVTLVECGRRVDPREWADLPPGLELEGPDNPALPDVDRREMETENEENEENEDCGDASSSGDDADDGSVDYRARFEATEAQTALDASSSALPVGIPRRALEARLRESARAARESDDPRRGGFFQRRLGNALAVAPWPRDGSPRNASTGTTADVMLARATGESATRVRIARLAREATTYHRGDASPPHRDSGGAETRKKSAPKNEKRKTSSRLRVAADFPLPTRAASQPVLQVELARVSHGWLARFEDDAQPALCAVRDPYGVSLSVLGGGARAVPTPARKPTRRISRSNFPIELLSPSPELLWSCAWNAPASAPADVRLSPHGLPELLVASRDGGLRVVDAAACDAAGGAERMKKEKHNKMREAARVAATPAGPSRGWCGCAYASNPRVALLATSRPVSYTHLTLPTKRIV